MELSILQAIQSVANPILDVLFIGVTCLGEPVAAVLVLTVVYWLVDKETGEYLAFTLLGSLNLNGAIKSACGFPRPIGQPGVRSLMVETATGTSFPSGHAQTTATLYPAIAWKARRGGVAFAAAAIPLLVGFSRLYLGVHWPRDVLAGLLLGALCSLAGYALFCSCNERGREWAYAACAAAFLPALLFWHDRDFVRAYGLLAGFALAVPLEHRFVRFDTGLRRGRKNRFLRELLGLAVLGAVKAGLGLALPDLLPLVALEYAAVAFCAFFLCPLLFMKLRL